MRSVAVEVFSGGWDRVFFYDMEDTMKPRNLPRHIFLYQQNLLKLYLFLPEFYLLYR